MSLYISSLNSGSNGNCYYVGNDREAVLIDAGISCREIEKRMQRSGLSMQKVKALFISHEHSDHIRGLEVLSRKHQIPVYITTPTLQQGRLLLEDRLRFTFRTNEAVVIGDLVVTPFHKTHDAADPHSFVVSCGELRVGVFTDIGHVCNNVIHHFKQCHAIFLESNYDDQMLESGAYPYHLKKRIRGGQGHLSNAQALALFNTHRPPFMRHVLLSHLSKDNNCPVLAKELFTRHSGNTEIHVAGRFVETPVIRVSTEVMPQPVQTEFRKQLSLF
jgi:phosphoribosyl 1,2-cyclic phosphodiesterase